MGTIGVVCWRHTTVEIQEEAVRGGLYLNPMKVDCTEYSTALPSPALMNVAVSTSPMCGKIAAGGGPCTASACSCEMTAPGVVRRPAGIRSVVNPYVEGGVAHGGWGVRR